MNYLSLRLFCGEVSAELMRTLATALRRDEELVDEDEGDEERLKVPPLADVSWKAWLDVEDCGGGCGGEYV